MPARHRLLFGLVAGLGFAAAVAAQEAHTPASQWIEAARTACLDSGDQRRCDDVRYIESQATILANRDVARRAAVRGNQQERRAVRELLTRHPNLCAMQMQQYCRERGNCSQRALTLCDTVKAQREQCGLQAAQFCRENRLRDCKAVVERQCPSAAADIDELLARYPGLNRTQEARLRQLANQLESGDASQLGMAIRTLLGLLGLG